MIQIIGIMIGVYTMTRFVSFLTRKGEHAESLAVKLLAVISMLITGLCMIALFASGGAG